MRFLIALWASKFYLFIKKLQNKHRSDRAGLLAARIYPDMLNRLSKPKTVIVVSGTNGKTTTTHMIYDMLIQEGLKIGFNDWNANMRAGYIRCLIDSVNIFNKPNKDVVILEADELTADETFGEVNPNYIIITNLANDSIRRNSYVERVFRRLNDGILKTNAKIILNADDPISSFLGEGKDTKFIGVHNLNKKPYEYLINDFSSCPRCNREIKYEYVQYRHIGRFICPSCGLTSKDSDYFVSKINKDNIVLNDYKYPILSSSIHNVYNEAGVIALFKEMGYTDKKISELLSNITITKSRQYETTINGHHLYAKLSKAQNGSSLSSVLEGLIDGKKKQVSILLDEKFHTNTMETITWLFDNNFELLNKLNLRKIIITGPRSIDYKFRIEFAGIDEKLIEIAPTYKDIHKLYDYDTDDDLYVLYDLDWISEGKEIFDGIVKDMEAHYEKN